MNEYCHSALYHGSDYLSKIWLKRTHVRQKDPGEFSMTFNNGKRLTPVCFLIHETSVIMLFIIHLNSSLDMRYHALFIIYMTDHFAYDIRCIKKWEE